MAIVGWRRVLSASPCDFCAKLAADGTVYSAAKTADFEAHDGCSCTAEPVWAKEAEPPEVVALQAEWDKVTAGLTGKQAIRAWRKHWQEKGGALGKAGGPDLAKMTVAQLKELAKARGIKGYSKLRKQELISALRPAPARAAKRAAPKPVDPLAQVRSGDFTALTKVDSRGLSGTNPGGLYRAADGSEWWVKQVADAEHARNETLSAALYRAAGIDVPEIVVGKGAPGLSGDLLASRFVAGASRFDPTDSAAMLRMRRGFAVDAWLANWDVMGGGFSNVVTVGGKPFRIDVGGSLLFRGGVGKPKGANFGDTVPEWRTLRDPNRSSHAARVYAGMSKTDLTEAAERVKKLTPAKIRSLVRQNGMPSSLADTLIARRADLLDQLKREFAPPPAPSAAILRARDKFDAAVAVGRIGQDALDQAPLRMVGDLSFNLSFEGAWSRLSAGLRPVVQRALRKYRGNDFQDINGVLRGKRAATIAVNGLIDAIEQGLAKSRLKQPVVVWRGVNTGESVFGPRASWPADLTGAEWTDPAFFSTSVDRGKAEDFAHAVLMRFVFPKGTPALQLSGYEYEAELMIGHGYRFRVIRDRGQGQTKHGRTVDRILDVEVIPPKPTKVP